MTFTTPINFYLPTTNRAVDYTVLLEFQVSRWRLCE